MVHHDQPSIQPANTSLLMRSGNDNNKPLSAKGRFARLAYMAWYLVISLVFLLVLTAVIVIAGLISQSSPEPHGNGLVTPIVVGMLFLVFVYFTVVITIRRLHDLNRSGWFSVLMFVPVINLFFMLYVMLIRGMLGANRFGALRANDDWEKGLGIVSFILCIIGLIALMALTVWGLDYVHEVNSLQYR